MWRRHTGMNLKKRGGEYALAHYEHEHRYVDVGILPILPDRVHETVMGNTETAEAGRGLDRDSRRESERKAWEDLHEDR